MSLVDIATMYQNDTYPSWTYQLTYADATVVNLNSASATTVKFVQMIPATAKVIVGTGTLTVTNATQGNISYAWNAADTALVGTFAIWVIVVFATGPEHFVIGQFTVVAGP